MTEQPKTLWACPTWSGGEYALKKWVKAFRSQTYPEIGAFMVDNSEDNLHYAHVIRAQGISCAWLPKRLGAFWDTMELCWVGPNGIVEYAHDNGYEFIFSVEHDVVLPPEATEKMVALSLEKAKDGKAAIVGHRYSPRGQPSLDFGWDTLGCTIMPVEPLWKDRHLAKANYEIECYITCKKNGHPRVRARDLFDIEHLKDPNDLRKDGFSGTPAVDTYAIRKIAYNERGKEEPLDQREKGSVGTDSIGFQETKLDLNPGNTLTLTPPTGKVKSLKAEPGHLTGSGKVVKPAKLKVDGKVKMNRPLPVTNKDFPINLHGISSEKELTQLVKEEERIRLNLGCGFQQVAGFIGVDFDPNVEPDIVSPIDDLPWCESDSVDMIFASHILEHLTMDESKVALKEWLRVLKPGGWLDVIVADINQVYLLYKKGSLWGEYQQLCDENYINATAFGANLLADAIPEMQDVYGGPGHQHKQIFIGDMLLNRVLEAGYVECHEVTANFLRRSSIGEVMVQARKMWFASPDPIPTVPPKEKE